MDISQILNALSNIKPQETNNSTNQNLIKSEHDIQPNQVQQTYNEVPHQFTSNIYPEPLPLDENGKILHNGVNSFSYSQKQNNTTTNSYNQNPYVNMPTYVPQQNNQVNPIENLKSILTPEFINTIKQILPLLQGLNLSGNGNLLSSLLGSKKNTTKEKSSSDTFNSSNIDDYIKIDNN